VDAWDIKLFQRHPNDDPEEQCPAEDFFEECPDSVAADLIAIIEAVAAGPPPRFRGSSYWFAAPKLAAPVSSNKTEGPNLPPTLGRGRALAVGAELGGGPLGEGGID
jgi:hypothetical protein